MTLWEDVQRLEQTVAAQQAVIENLQKRLTIAEVEAKEVKTLRRGAYWIVGLIIAGAIGFGFSVLTLIPHA